MSVHVHPASSLAYDRGGKAALYARFGVPEYWVVDANDRCAWVHTAPKADGYADVTAVSRAGRLRPQTPDLASIDVDLAALG